MIFSPRLIHALPPYPIFLLYLQRRLKQSAVSLRLVLGQVVIELPLGYLRDVLLPLLPLRSEEVRRDVLTKCFLDDRILLELVARLFEVVRQIVDLETTLLAMRHLPDVRVHRLPCIRLVLDSIESGSK